jgi:hypothetical protein
MSSKRVAAGTGSPWSLQVAIMSRSAPSQRRKQPKKLFALFKDVTHCCSTAGPQTYEGLAVGVKLRS